MDENVNAVEIKNGNEVRKSKKALVVIGTIFLVIAYILTICFISISFPYLTGNSDLSSAFGIILGILYFLIPGGIAALISSILNGLAWKKVNVGKWKIYSLITFVLSLVSLISLVLLFIYILIK